MSESNIAFEGCLLTEASFCDGHVMKLNSCTIKVVALAKNIGWKHHASMLLCWTCFDMIEEGGGNGCLS